MTTRSILTLLSTLAVFSLSTPAASAADNKPVDEFTSTAEKKSKLIEKGNDYAKYRCKGLGGYEVIYVQSDGRSWIDLVYDSEETNLMNDIFQSFEGMWKTKANDVVQWRGTKVDGQFVPYAIIFRMEAVQDDQTFKRAETLVVIKLAGAGSKVVGSVPASKGNEAAEALADKLCKME